ncbi:hypothetical protein ABZW30_15800 [Kitasatospora sp. NPDC004669]|uniref:hypothetical protein n=1 Tax=Kitasatospora sp. NPDC004669 TaxID=3154555 RepID=UPI0033A379EF
MGRADRVGVGLPLRFRRAEFGVREGSGGKGSGLRRTSSRAVRSVRAPLLDALLRYRNQADELIRAGELALDTDANGQPEEWGSSWSAWSERSPFHRTLGGHRGAADRLGGWNAFQQYRVVLNWLYLDMYRIGIGELERNLVCHVVSRAVEDVNGVTAMDRIQDLIGFVDSGGRL